MNFLELPGKIKSAPSMSAVSKLLEAAATPLGFPTHAIGPVPTEMRPVEDGAFLVQNWPREWGEQYERRGFGAFDPVPRAATVLMEPMALSEIMDGGAGFAPDPRAHEIIDLSSQMGRPEGFIVPIFGPGGYRAIVAFGGPGPKPDAETSAILHLWAIYAHQRIRVLAEQDILGVDGDLSKREIQVLTRLQNGMQDKEIAASLGISVRTVRFHIQNSRQKLNAQSRSDLISKISRLDLKT